MKSLWYYLALWTASCKSFVDGKFCYSYSYDVKPMKDNDFDLVMSSQSGFPSAVPKISEFLCGLKLEDDGYIYMRYWYLSTEGQKCWCQYSCHPKDSGPSNWTCGPTTEYSSRATNCINMKRARCGNDTCRGKSLPKCPSY